MNRKNVSNIVNTIFLLAIFREIISLFDWETFSERLSLYGKSMLVVDIILFAFAFSIMFLMPNILLNLVINKVENSFIKISIRFLAVGLFGFLIFYLFYQITEIQLPFNVLNLIGLIVPFIIITLHAHYSKASFLQRLSLD